MRSLERALIQYNWFPYKKGKFVHRHTQREVGEETQGEDKRMWGYRKPREKREQRLPLCLQRRHGSADTTSSGLQNCGTINFCCSSKPSICSTLLWWLYGTHTGWGKRDQQLCRHWCLPPSKHTSFLIAQKAPLVFMCPLSLA